MVHNLSSEGRLVQQCHYNPNKRSHGPTPENKTKPKRDRWPEEQQRVDRGLLQPYTMQRACSVIKVLMDLPPTQITRAERLLDGGMRFTPSQAMKQCSVQEHPFNQTLPHTHCNHSLRLCFERKPGRLVGSRVRRLRANAGNPRFRGRRSLRTPRSNAPRSLWCIWRQGIPSSSMPYPARVFDRLLPRMSALSCGDLAFRSSRCPRTHWACKDFLVVL